MDHLALLLNVVVVVVSFALLPDVLKAPEEGHRKIRIAGRIVLWPLGVIASFWVLEALEQALGAFVNAITGKVATYGALGVLGLFGVVTIIVDCFRLRRRMGGESEGQ